MRLGQWALALSLSHSPDRDPAPALPAAAQEARRLVLETEGIDKASVKAALALRLRDFEFVDAPVPDAFLVRIEVAGDAVRVQVQRGTDRWTRQLQPSMEDPLQEIATACANLVTTVAYEVPEPPPVVDVPADVDADADSDANANADADEPANADAESDEPTMGETGSLEERAARPEPNEPPVPAEPVVWTISPTLAAQTTLELTTPSDGVLSGFGGSLGVDARHRNGGLLHFEARALGRGYTTDITLARLRLAVGGGYARQRRRWTLGVVGAVAIEPWWPLRNRARAEVLRERVPSRPAPMLGAHARLVARRSFGEGSVRFWLGPRLELSGMLSPDGGIPQLLVSDARGDTRSLGSLGGLEIGLGLEFGLQIAAQRGR
ncbi:MAG: hypothetical protein AAGF11_53725 [Myxococcota bacterium]